MVDRVAAAPSALAVAADAVERAGASMSRVIDGMGANPPLFRSKRAFARIHDAVAVARSELRTAVAALAPLGDSSTPARSFVQGADDALAGMAQLDKGQRWSAVRDLRTDPLRGPDAMQRLATGMRELDAGRGVDWLVADVGAEASTYPSIARRAAVVSLQPELAARALPFLPARPSNADPSLVASRLESLKDGLGDQQTLEMWAKLVYDVDATPGSTLRGDDLKRMYRATSEAAASKYGHEFVAPPTWVANLADDEQVPVDAAKMYSLNLHQLKVDRERLVERVTTNLRMPVQPGIPDDRAKYLDAIPLVEGGVPFDVPTGLLADDALAEAWSWQLRTERARTVAGAADPSRPLARINDVLVDGNDAFRMRGATKVAHELAAELPASPDPAVTTAVDELRATLEAALPKMDRDQFPEYAEYGQALATSKLLATIEAGGDAATVAKDLPRPDGNLVW